MPEKSPQKSEISPKSPQIGRKMSENASKSPQIDRKTAENGPKTAENGQKMAENGEKVIKTSENGPVWLGHLILPCENIDETGNFYNMAFSRGFCDHLLIFFGVFMVKIGIFMIFFFDY
jgi:hypothetical protein